MLNLAIASAERGLVPDLVIRKGIRSLLRRRLHEIDSNGADVVEGRAFAEQLRSRPVAEHVRDANDQHYEVPAAFYQAMLGPRLKYSSGLWSNPAASLADAETAMLRLTCERAELEDGMEVLDLGCGWGSFSLWVAEHYPQCRVMAVSNSASQKAFIENRARERGWSNLEVRTADVSYLELNRSFDRVVSIEMFEHMRNYEILLERLAGWLRPDGKLFVHIFTHRNSPYLFETEGADNWMGRHFFSGGTMPAHDTLYHFPRHLRVEADWRVNGEHYAKTLESWLVNMDKHAQQILRLFESTYGKSEAARRIQRWRMFLMSCSELFGFRGGTEWHVSHYRMVKTADGAGG